MTAIALCVAIATSSLVPGVRADDPRYIERPATVQAAPPQPREAHRKPRVARGLATWYSGREGRAAAGPVLRRALRRAFGSWRGRHVLVCVDKRCADVRLTDWCACGKRHGVPTLLDLSRADFAYLRPLSRGVITVSVGY